MKLLEIEGKKLFKTVGIDVPRDILISKKSDMNKVFAPCIVKAQVLFGHRGQKGLVKKAQTVKEADDLINNYLSTKNVFGVVVENVVDVEREYYLSLMIDAGEKDVVGIFSSKGGMDIEKVAWKFPDNIIKFPIDKRKIQFALSKGVKNAKERKRLVALILTMYKLMKKVDAELIELNPLAVTKKRLVALDAKVVIDSKALYRQKQFVKHEHRELTGRELEAAHYGLHYVDLDGDMGIIGDGAGLVMATLDTCAHYGGKPANFLDVGGGAGEKRMFQAMRLVTSKKLKGLFINIFGGITLCDEIAHAIVKAKKKLRLRIPMVVRLAGTNVAKGVEILKQANVDIAPSMDVGIRRIIKKVKRGK
jgi:succinyl-CoA synthetase beta subunit